MNIFSKLFYKAGDFLNFKSKWANYPTITGGSEIFRNMAWEGMSAGKKLDTYHKSLYVFACVWKIAQKTASIDWEMFRIKNKVGDTQELFVHEALDLLYRPNPFQTKAQFFERFMINKKLAGEAFILKVRNDQGKVVELWNLRPDYMAIVKDKELFIKAYEFSKGDGSIVTFDPADIIHDSYPNPTSDFGGFSALYPAAVRIETEWNATQYQKNFFRNNARPDFILSSDNKIDKNQKEEIKERWEKRHEGSKNTGKGAFLEGGLKYQQVSISQREMDYIESLRMTRDDILTAFSVPKAIVAITDDVNLANAKTAMEIFLSETIEPEIKALTEKLNEHLIYPEYGDIFFIKYDRSFLPQDEKQQAEIHQIQIQSGVKLINEAREEIGLPPVTGGWSLYKPFSETPVGGLSGKSSSKEFNDAQKAKAGHIFRGRSKAIRFLEVREIVAKEVYAGIEKSLTRQVKKVGTKSIITPEIRGNYYDVINKSIDKKGESMKPSILKYGEDQKERVLSALRASKSLETKAVDGLFDKSKENKLLAEISFPFITDFVMEAGEEAMQLVNPAEEFTATERIQKFISERARQMAREVNDTTIEKLSRVLSEGIDAGEGIADLTDRVNSVYEEYPNYRAEAIARTEATAANNRGFLESYEQSGVANAKEWISTGDGRTRDTHDIDGEIVGIDKNFSNGLSYPGDPGADPSETINCRCVLAPAFKE